MNNFSLSLTTHHSYSSGGHNHCTSSHRHCNLLCDCRNGCCCHDDHLRSFYSGCILHYIPGLLPGHNRHGHILHHRVHHRVHILALLAHLVRHGHILHHRVHHRVHIL